MKTGPNTAVVLAEVEDGAM